MSIVEIRATVSHRYYMNKTKEEIRYRLQMLHRAVHGKEAPAEVQRQWRGVTKDTLADYAMAYHRKLPE